MLCLSVQAAFIMLRGSICKHIFTLFDRQFIAVVGACMHTIAKQSSNLKAV